MTGSRYEHRHAEEPLIEPKAALADQARYPERPDPGRVILFTGRDPGLRRERTRSADLRGSGVWTLVPPSSA